MEYPNKPKLELYQFGERSQSLHMPIGAYFVQQDGEDGDYSIMRKYVTVLSSEQQHVQSEEDDFSKS